MGEGVVEITIRLPVAAHGALLAMVRYDGCETVEECVLECLASEVQAYFEASKTDHTRQLFGLGGKEKA